MSERGVVAVNKKTIFERLNVKYEEKDGFLCPLIKQEVGQKCDVGKYGLLWMKYIRSEYPKRYTSLLRFGELNKKAAEVNEVAYDLLDDIEREWLNKHKPKNRNSFQEIHQLRTEARAIAEEVVMHDVVHCYH